MAWEGMKDNIVYHTLTEQELNEVTSKMQMAHGHATQLSGTSLGVDDTNPDLHRSLVESEDYYRFPLSSRQPDDWSFNYNKIYYVLNTTTGKYDLNTNPNWSSAVYLGIYRKYSETALAVYSTESYRCQEVLTSYDTAENSEEIP